MEQVSGFLRIDMEPGAETVPLKDEAGREVGTAVVHPDGTFDAEVTDEDIIEQIRDGFIDSVSVRVEGVVARRLGPFQEGPCL